MNILIPELSSMPTSVCLSISILLEMKLCRELRSDRKCGYTFFMKKKRVILSGLPKVFLGVGE